MTEQDQQRISLWLSGELKGADADAFVRWRRQTPGVDAEIEAQEALHALLQTHAPHRFSPSFADGVLAQLPAPPAPARRLARRDRAPQTSSRSRRPAGRWLLAVPVVLLLVAAAWLTWSALAPRGEVFTAGPGAPFALTLPDGSAVTLAPGSTLRYAADFGRTARNVVLRGEAFFAVQRGAMPFQVRTFNARVRVVGTRFNVRAWPEEHTPATAVSVAEGHVQLQLLPPEEAPDGAARRSSAAPLDLTAGQEAAASEGRITRSQAAPLPRRLAWLEGGLAFEDLPLTDVFAALERRFGVRITLDASAGGTAQRITYLHPGPSRLETVLSDIVSTVGLQYRPTADGYEIVGR